MQRFDHLKGVILDWAGTTVDFGCMAPAAVFVQCFKKHGVEVSMLEARAPMGQHKRDHIAAMFLEKPLKTRWEQAKGLAPTEKDVDALYADFVPMQMACLENHSQVIPHVVEAIEAMRSRGLKIGSTTGYTRQMMDVVAPLAKAQGYAPDFLVCSDEVSGGRPLPWMCFRNAENLQISPLSHVVKIGDTPQDIHEGLRSQMWTIGLTVTGNEAGLSRSEFEALPLDEQNKLHEKARGRLQEAGAHFVARNLGEALLCLEEIEELMASGKKP